MVCYIDLHTHLDHHYYGEEIEDVLKRAKEAGVGVIITNGLDAQTNRKTLELSKRYDLVKAALGLYPVDSLKRECETGEIPMKHYSSFDIDEEIKFIEENKGNIIAIGEIGLDFVDEKTDRKTQEEHFRKMLDLAKRLDLPVMIHSRKAESEVLDILEDVGVRKVILHCFCGKKKLIEKAVKLGYYFTIPTNVVRAQNFQEMIKMVPLTKLFCETDGPYLSPFKNKDGSFNRNESAFVVESYKKIAEIKGMELEEVKNAIYMNFQKLF